jgi:multisubunit Na+/H+ antiporter MnhF subunit
MTTTAIAALVTLFVGLFGFLWLVTRGRRADRMTACVLMCVFGCLALVFFSIGQGGMDALDAALLVGILAPMGTLLVAARGRGLRRTNGGHRAR